MTRAVFLEEVHDNIASASITSRDICHYVDVEGAAPLLYKHDTVESV